MKIERVSVASDGSQGNSYSEKSAISSDGRYVAFSSFSSNLVSGDTNNNQDIFVHDRQTGKTTRVSLASDGTEANNNSFEPAIGGDGRYIAFISYADNLVPGGSDREWKGLSSTVVDENGETQQVLLASDVFVRDRQTGETKRVNVASDGTLANNDSSEVVISEDGRYVAFTSFADNLVPGDTNNARDIFVRDLQTEETTRVNLAAGGIEANGASYFTAISGDGRFVAFESDADNLVAGDTNNTSDIFVHDRQAGETTRVSVASDGTEGNNFSSEGSNVAISADGRYVAFQSHATNLVPGDTNNTGDIFVHDRETGETTRVTVASDGTQANGWNFEPSISADGRYVAFSSNGDNLALGDKEPDVDLFIHDRETKETKQISAGWNSQSYISFEPSISADRRYIAFHTVADNLVPGDTNNETDVFVYDRLATSDDTDGVTKNGNNANNKLNGSEGPDILDGKGGNDTIIGGPDNDILIGGGGKDTLNGGPGDDLYRLDAKTAKGSEIVDAGGSDILELENADIFLGGSTRVQRQGKNLIIDLNADGKVDKKDDLTLKNFFAAGKENRPGVGFIETVDNLSGRDVINIVDTYQEVSKKGNNKKNTLKGNDGKDFLDGRGGNDKLMGNDGEDTLIGGKGNDRLIGGPRADVLTGGKGSDRFIFDNIPPVGKEDIITDFGRGDKIVLDLDTFDRLAPNLDFAEQFAVVKRDRDVASKDALVIYNETNGNLFYNPNGSIGGFGGGGLLANLADSPELDGKDFILRS
jgi:Tol biopolymer transport system component